MKSQQLAYIYALLAIIFWSTAATAFKISLQYLNYIQVVFIASVTSTIVLFLILLSQKKIKNVFSCTKKQYLYSAFLGLINPFLYYLVLLKAYSLLPAQVAQPINYTWPLVLVLLSIPLLKQKLTNKTLIAFFVSMLGVYIISSQGKWFEFNVDKPQGLILAFVSSIFWALFWIFNIKDKRDEITKLFLNFLFGSCFLAIPFYLTSGFENLNSTGVLGSIYIGFFEMGITFVLWLKALQLTTSNEKIGNLVYLSPFLALIFIHYILGEEIFPTTATGLVFIVGGIILQRLGKENKQSISNN